jgi:hypothetical protein
MNYKKPLDKIQICIIIIYRVGLERPEVKPVERRKVSMKQEAPLSIRWGSSQRILALAKMYYNKQHDKKKYE